MFRRSSTATKAIRDFCTCRRGSVLIMFSMIVMVLLGGAGLAIDYARAVAIKDNAQNALDAAVLAATDSLVPTDEKEERFNTVFEVNFSSENAKVERKQFSYQPGAGGSAEADIKIATVMMRLFGINELNMPVTSSANQEGYDIEVALVLDVSGSMRYSMGGTTRLQALKDSANRLIDILEESKAPEQSIKYSIIPFTMNVNIGKDRGDIVYAADHALFSGTEWQGCVLERPAPHTNTDGFTNASSAKHGGRWHAYIWPPEPNSNSRCINPSDGTNDGYKTVQADSASDPYNPWTKGPNFNCVRHPIMSLTDDHGAARSKIAELTSRPNMGTMLAPGVSWGHRVLSPAEPFSEGKDFNKGVRKVMVVITDGEQTTEGPHNSGCKATFNTKKPYKFHPRDFDLEGSNINLVGPRDMFSPYGYMYDSVPLGLLTGWPQVADEMDSLALDACTQFKSRGRSTNDAALYTIAASSGAAPGTRVHNTLKACASTPGHFFFAGDADSLNAAFEKIARETAGLRLTH